MRTLSTTCNFGNLKEEQIRGRLVCGVKENSIRRKLLQESDLTLKKCLDLCRASEATSPQLKVIGGRESLLEQSQDINTLSNRPRSKTSRDTEHTKPGGKDKLKRCMYCGRSHDKQRDSFPAFGKVCRACGRNNHFAIVCKAKTRSDLGERNANMVEQSCLSETTSSDDEVLTVTLESVEAVNVVVDSVKPKRKILAPMEIASRYRCILQRNSSIILIPLKTTITRTVHTLKMYSKSIMPELGTCFISLRNPKNRKKYSVEFVVVRGNYHPLLGSRTSQQMGLLKVQPENILQVDNQPEIPAAPITSQASRESILQRYDNVFDGLGHMEGKLHLEVNKAAKPTVMPPRRVPLAIKKLLKEELDRLEKLNVILKVEEPTHLVSSLVPVKKPNGNIRACIDPQHLNQALKRSHYVLPVINDILPDLGEAKVFSKADLKDGFLHIELDGESSILTTFQTPWGRFCWKRLPFGVAPAPEWFQRKLDQNLEGLNGVYRIFDDILITGKGDTEEEAEKDHENNLIKFLERCQERNLKLNRDTVSYM